MNLLLLGGMKFLGRAVVDAALARGHRVTIFNRGRSAAPPAGVERLTGDRDGGLGALDGRDFDAVIDTSGYLPRLVRDSAQRLAAHAGHYVFVSSISVYTEHGPHQNEDAPVAVLEDPFVEEVTGPTYGGLKVLCERAVLEAMPGRAAIVRPGLIVGPHDSTDRFPHWIRRMAGGGEVLAPGDPEGPVQIIDVRDLADWMVRLAEAKTEGVFNATGPADPLTFGTMLETLRAATGGTARPTWVDAAFLLENGVAPFSNMPLWLPPEVAGHLRLDIGRALGAGLTFRPLEETARDTLAWERVRTDEERATARSGLTGAPIAPDRERELLEAWRRRAPAAGSA